MPSACGPALRLFRGCLLGALLVPEFSAAPVPLSRAIEVRRMQAPEKTQARLRGVVTAFSGWKNSFFIQDASGSVSVDRTENAAVIAGDLVEVEGEVRKGSFAPVLLASRTHVLGHPGLPKPKTLSGSELLSGRHDSELVCVEGVIHDVQVEQIWGRPILVLNLSTSAGPVIVHVQVFPRDGLESLIDSEVRISGVAGTVFNDRRQMIGVRLFVEKLRDVKVALPAPMPAALPVTHIAQLLRFGVGPSGHREHVRGVVTYQGSAGELFLQQDADGIRIETTHPQSFPAGTVLDAWGFVRSRDFAPVLEDAALTPVSGAGYVKPLPVHADDLLKTEDGFSQAPFDGRLVELEADIIDRLPSSTGESWQLRSGGSTFRAEINGSLPPLSGAEPGSRVRLTGVCVAEAGADAHFTSFRILVPSWKNVVAVRYAYWNSSLLLLFGLLVFLFAGTAVVGLAHSRHANVPIDAPSHQIKRRFQQVSRVLAASVAAAGAIVMLAWRVSYAHPGVWAAIFRCAKPNSALGMSLVGLAILLDSPRAQKRTAALQLLPGIIATFVSALTLLQFAFAHDMHVDLFIFGSGAVTHVAQQSTRMSLGAAFCFALAGISSLAIRSRRLAALGQILSVSTAAICSLNLIGGLFGYRLQVGPGAHTTMSAPMSFAVLCLSASLLLRHPDRGLMRNICSVGMGGLIARRMIPLAFLCPIVLGWIRLQGQIYGLYDTRFGLALFVVMNIVLSGLLIWSSAAVLNGLDRSRSSAQQALSDRDGKLEMIFGTGAIGDFTWELGPDTVTAHPSVWKLYGEPWGAGSGPAEWFRERQHPEDRDWIAAQLQHAISKRAPFEVEFRVIWPDDSVHWVACRGIPEFSGDRLVRVNGLNIDITERKNAVQRLAQSEAEFRELADAMPQIVWVSGGDGSVIYLNRRWFDYTGAGPADNARDRIHPDDQDLSTAIWDESKRRATPYECELRLRGKREGSYRWHLARAVPLINSDGRVERWFGTSTDIDEFKKVSAELSQINEDLEQTVRERSLQLAESERRHRELLESISDYAIFMLDADGRVAIWNAGAERILGYPAAEILGCSHSAFYGGADVEAGHPAHELEAALETRHSRREGWAVRKDGTQFWASVLVSAIRDSNGAVLGFSKVLRDMTEQKRAEDLLIDAHGRAEEASRAKSNFLAVMSHEIRTPMNAILGMADLLSETELDPAQREYVSRFRRAGSNLLALINDILDLSKVESGRFELEAIEFDLGELIERTIDLMETRTREKVLTLAAEIDPMTPLRLIGDPVRLQQILINLIGNAIKFTARGRVLLSVSPHADRERGHLLFQVEDTGIGVAKDRLQMIFEDFAQGESSTTRVFGGTGLGLGIARRLVAAMGGQLGVDSEPGCGSEFFFDARFALSPAANSCTAAAPRDLAGLRVLIFDESATNRLTLAEMCTGFGMVPSAVSSASNVCELVSRAAQQNEPYSAVLFDRASTNTDWTEAVQATRAADGSVAILVTRGEHRPGDATKAAALGVSAFLDKPVRRSALMDRLSSGVADRAPQATRPGGSSMRILVAEDSEDNCFLVAAYLKNLPYELTFARNGADAVDEFARAEFDLVLMDVQMPVIDGLVAAARIRQIEAARGNRPTPIIALTANAFAEDAERSAAAGCNAHLSKPISKSRLIGAIESMLRAGGRADIGTPVPLELNELSVRYIRARRSEVAELEVLLNSRDFAGLATAAHNLKGTGTSFGFPDLTAIGAALEEDSKAGDFNRVQAKLAELQACLSHACETNSDP